MSELNPFGINQTTGQKVPISSTDNVVDNIGQQIEVVTKAAGDYSGSITRTTVFSSWQNPTTLSTPASLTGYVRALCWSPDGEFLATSSNATPFMRVFQKTGSNLYPLANPPSLPTNGVTAVTWSFDGSLVAFSSNTAPRLNTYERSGSTLTLLPAPASAPTGTFAQDLQFSPNGEFLAVAEFASPFLEIYQRNGTTFNLLSSPASLPPSETRSVSWSPDSQFLTVGFSTTPFFHVYQRTGLTTFTKLATPASLPIGAVGCNSSVAWAPNGRYFAVASSTAGPPNTFIYQLSGTTLNLVTTAATGSSWPIGWSSNSRYLAVAQTSAGQIDIYQYDGTSLTFLNAPASFPGNFTGQPAWSFDGKFFAVGLELSPFLAVYQTGSTLPSSGVAIERM